jgi:hypothetical protein
MSGTPMICLMRVNLIYWLRALWPALLVLTLSIFLSLLLGEFAFLRSDRAILKGILRFSRFAVLSYLTLYLVLPLNRWLLRQMKQHLLQVADSAPPEFSPLKIWVYRPLQCIGTSLLFDTKLIIALQLVAGSTVSDSLLPKGRFNIELFLATTLVTAVTSLLLASIWTLDDTGIRYFNRKEHELKMAGKFVGTIMPIVFGFSGVRGLLATFPTMQAMTYLSYIFIILYPPFTAFSVLHYNFVKRKYDSFSGIGGLRKGMIRETNNGDVNG